MKHKFAVIGAMQSEVEQLSLLLSEEEANHETYAGLCFHRGIFHGQELTVVRCGPGKVNAARCAQILIDRFTPDYLINTGIAGGIGAGLAVGDFVIGTELVQHDFDVTAFGHAKGYLCTGEDTQKPTVFRADAVLVATFEKAAVSLLSPMRVKRGRIATGDVFVSDAARKHAIVSEFSAIAVEMEGAAIAQVATAAGVPCVFVRAISDLADGTAAASFDVFEQEMAVLSASVVTEMLRQYE